MTTEKTTDSAASALSAGFGGVSPAPTFEDELLDLLAMMFDAYEDGPDCYEDPEDCSGHIGKAIHLDDDAFQRIADILNAHRPRVTPNVEFRRGEALACNAGLGPCAPERIASEQALCGRSLQQP